MYSIICDLNIIWYGDEGMPLLKSTVSLQALRKELYFHQILQKKLNTVILVG